VLGAGGAGGWKVRSPSPCRTRCARGGLGPRGCHAAGQRRCRLPCSSAPRRHPRRPRPRADSHHRADTHQQRRHRIAAVLMTTRGRWWRLASLRTTFRYHPHRMSALLERHVTASTSTTSPRCHPPCGHTQPTAVAPRGLPMSNEASQKPTRHPATRRKGKGNALLLPSRDTRESVPRTGPRERALPFEAVVLHGLPGASVGAPAGVWAARPPEAAMPRDEAAAQGAHLLQRCSCRHPARCRRPPSRADSQDADGWSQLPATSIRAGQRSRGSERNTPIAKYCAAPP